MLGKIFSFILCIVTGGISGMIAGNIMHSEGSTLRNIVLGIIGGVVGSFVLGLVGISGGGIIGGMLVSIFGSCLLIFLGKKFL